MSFSTPQDAEDAFYDAIDDNDFEAMMMVWEESSETTCLLPMQPMLRGTDDIAVNWQAMMGPETKVEVSVQHLQWIEQGDLAIHLVEETVLVGPNKQAQPPIYGTNIYRRDGEEWRMLAHLNSPTPPPPGAMGGGMGAPDTGNGGPPPGVHF